MRWSLLAIAVISAACSDSIRSDTDGGAGSSAGSSAGSGGSGVAAIGGSGAEGGSAGQGAVGGTAGAGGVGASGGTGGAAANGGTGGAAANGGTGGAAAIGGTGGVGANGGTGGSGGLGGFGGSGGLGGSGGSGGVGGGGGGGSASPQCTTDRDCVLQSDCCTCNAFGAAVSFRPIPACPIDCLVDTCTSLGVERAACTAGRCVLDVSCDENEAQCDGLPPQCALGQAPIVSACYGQCIEARLCREVTNCDVCTRDQVCVSHVSRGGSTHHCVPRPVECGNGATCECMGDSVCTGAFNACSDTNGAISCACPTC